VKDELDSIATVQSDLDFQVSTDDASVREFLDAPFTGAKIIFSTYQSAHVVGAVLKPGEAFDLAVFDEAHKTAGREGRNYAFALEDANLQILKRLFLTATRATTIRTNRTTKATRNLCSRWTGLRFTALKRSV